MCHDDQWGKLGQRSFSYVVNFHQEFNSFLTAYPGVVKDLKKIIRNRFY